MKSSTTTQPTGLVNGPVIGAARTSKVWTIADILSHFVPQRSLNRLSAKQLQRVRRPLGFLQEFRHGTFRAIASFPFDDNLRFSVGIKFTGEFTLLSHNSAININQIPDWNSLEISLAEQASPLCNTDQELLHQHLAQQWRRALKAAQGAPQLKALLARWQVRGVHFAMAKIMAAQAAYADPHAVNLLRSVGSRSIAVYNWLCATKAYRATRCAALRLEPALLAHAICHRSACTDHLLQAVDQRNPLRVAIRQAFGLTHDEIRYLNRVVGVREVSPNLFETLMRHIASLPSEVRPTNFKRATWLAAEYDQHMLDPLDFLFPARLRQALGPVTTLFHRQAVHRTWARYAIQQQRLEHTRRRSAHAGGELDWLDTDDDDLEEEDKLVPVLYDWYDGENPMENENLAWELTGLTPDQLFEEWLLALPPDALRTMHLRLCRLSVSRRASYLAHWRFALPASLQLCTAMRATFPVLVAGIAQGHGFAMADGKTAQFITPQEFDAWNTTSWRLRPLTCAAQFKQAATQLDNCIADPCYHHAALRLNALYIRLTATCTAEETLIEFLMTEPDADNAAAGPSVAANTVFIIGQHLGVGNMVVSRESEAKAVQFLRWLNQQFGATPRGAALAAVRGAIRSALAVHVAANRAQFISAAAARVHKQGLR